MSNAGVMVPPESRTRHGFELRAATDPDAAGGDYYVPDGFHEMRGWPTTVGRTEAAEDPEVASRRWSVSEDVTGVTFGFLGATA